MWKEMYVPFHETLPLIRTDLKRFEGLAHSCRGSPGLFHAPCDSAVKKMNCCPKRNPSIITYFVSLSCFMSKKAHTHTYTHRLTQHSSAVKELWVGRPPGTEWKEAATEDVRLYLTYSSFEICWWAPHHSRLRTAPDLMKSTFIELSGKVSCHRARTSVCLCVCVFAGKSVWTSGATLASSDKTLLLSRVRWSSTRGQIVGRKCEGWNRRHKEIWCLT